MPLIELARYSNRALASIAQSALASVGIESFVFDEQMMLMPFEIPARLMVLDEDLTEAKRLLTGDTE